MDLPKGAINRLAGDHRGGYDLFLHSDAPPGRAWVPRPR
jgi:hypothetical protein